MPGTTVHGITAPDRMAWRVPTVSMTHARIPPPQVAERLARDGVCVWSGHNYALGAVRHLGFDEAAGVVRIGLAHYNTGDEVDATLAALEGRPCERPVVSLAPSRPLGHGSGIDPSPMT